MNDEYLKQLQKLNSMNVFLNQQTLKDIGKWHVEPDTATVKEILMGTPQSPEGQLSMACSGLERDKRAIIWETKAVIEAAHRYLSAAMKDCCAGKPWLIKASAEATVSEIGYLFGGGDWLSVRVQEDDRYLNGFANAATFLQKVLKGGASNLSQHMDEMARKAGVPVVFSPLQVKIVRDNDTIEFVIWCNYALLKVPVAATPPSQKKNSKFLTMAGQSHRRKRT